MTKSIIVTGAARGIGESIARAASSAGYRVGVLDIDGAGAAIVADSLANGVALEAAINDPDQVEAALDTFGTPDALVNNAGIVRFGPLLEHSVDAWRAVVDVNLTGTFVCSTACARRMAASGAGSIVSLTSINGIAPGMVRTPFNEDKLSQPEWMEYYQKRIPVGRLSLTQEIGRIIAFLASEHGEIINGTIVDATGGMLI